MEAEDRQQARQRAEERRQRAAETIEKALTDPIFRQRFVEGTAADGDARAPFPPAAQVLRRQVLEQVLARAASDQQFHQQLGQKPRQALLEAGFGPQLEQLRAELPQDEVRGYAGVWDTAGGGGYTLWVNYGPIFTGWSGW